MWRTYITPVSLQQAFNATAVIRHMRRLQLSTGGEAPNPSLPGEYPPHLLMAEEGAGSSRRVSVPPNRWCEANTFLFSPSPQRLAVKAGVPRMSKVPQTRCPTAPTAATRPAVSDLRPSTRTCLSILSNCQILSPSVKPEAPSPPQPYLARSTAQFQPVACRGCKHVEPGREEAMKRVELVVEGNLKSLTMMHHQRSFLWWVDEDANERGGLLPPHLYRGGCKRRVELDGPCFFCFTLLMQSVFLFLFWLLSVIFLASYFWDCEV